MSRFTGSVECCRTHFDDGRVWECGEPVEFVGECDQTGGYADTYLTSDPPTRCAHMDLARDLTPEEAIEMHRRIARAVSLYQGIQREGAGCRCVGEVCRC